MKEIHEVIVNSIVASRDYLKPTISPEARKRIKDKILQRTEKVVYNSKEEQ